MTGPGKTPSSFFSRRIGRWIVAGSIIVIGVATLHPGSAIESTGTFCIICGTFGGVDAVLNVGLFVPFGVGLAVMGLRARNAVGLGFAFSVLIELLQLQGVPGRDAGIGDIITNSLGTTVGFLLGRHVATLLSPDRRVAGVLAAGWLAMWLAVQALVAYSLTPSLPEGTYYAQIARARPGVFVFPGLVLSAYVGAADLKGGKLENTGVVQSLLGRRDGAATVVRVIPTGETPGRAEIVVISGPRMVGIMSFEQDARSLVFGLRTGAERLRLRPYEFRLAGAFEDAARGLGDTTALAGHFTSRQVLVSARSRQSARQETFVPRLSWGWRLLTPFRLYVENDLRSGIASIAFLALLILPVGYWGRRALETERSGPRRAAAIGFLAAVVAIGFVAIPLSLGLRTAAWWEFLAVIAGVTLGAFAFRAAPNSTHAS